VGLPNQLDHSPFLCDEGLLREKASRGNLIVREKTGGGGLRIDSKVDVAARGMEWDGLVDG